LEEELEHQTLVVQEHLLGIQDIVADVDKVVDQDTELVD
jgi:hypothetical protein